MGFITSNTFPKARTAFPCRWFDTSFKAQDDSWKQLYTTRKSTMAYEQALGFQGFGLMKRKEETQSVYWDTAAQGFATNYVHVMWALGFRHTLMAKITDVNGRILERLSKALGRSVAETLRYLAFLPLNEAFSSTAISNTGITYGDGKTLCATDHPAEGTGGGTLQNRPTTDCVLSEAAINDARITIRRWKTGRNHKISAMTAGLVFTPENSAEAFRLLSSEKRPDDGTNAVNFIKGQGYFPKGGLETPYIDSTDDWFITTDQTENGFQHYELIPVTFGRDEAADALYDKYLAYMACSFGCDHPTAIYGSAGVA